MIPWEEYKEFVFPTIMVAGGVCFLAGYLFGRIGNRKLRAEVQRVRNNSVQTEVQHRQKEKELLRTRAATETLKTFIGKLTEGVQNLNRARLDQNGVDRMILGLASAVFDPEQILLYRTVRVGNRLYLALKEQEGLQHIPSELESIAFGVGRLGWVAEHQVEMTGKDWHEPTRTEGADPGENHPMIKTDLISPIIRNSMSVRNKTFTAGVLCVGNPRTRRDSRESKLMLQTISHLGAIAYSHVYSMAEMESKANYDGLTGLMVKRHFREELGKKIIEKEHNVGSLGVFIFDIDHFKNYNDTNGHPEGDELLRELAFVIKSNLRPGDLACRYGGEEFVVAMPGADRDASIRAAERIRLAIERHTNFRHGDKQPGGRLTISGGVSVYPQDGTSGEELIRHADEALYNAKNGGRNRVCKYEGVQFGSLEEDEIMDEFGQPYPTDSIEGRWPDPGKA